MSTVAVKFFFTCGQKLKERRLDFIAQSTSAECFPCLRHVAFRGNTSSWLRAVKELSQVSVMLRVSVFSCQFLQQRCCFHLFAGGGRLGHDIVLALNFSTGWIAKLRQLVNNSLKEVSGDGNSYWNLVAVWEEQCSCQLRQGVSSSFYCPLWNTGLFFVVNMQNYGYEVHQHSYFTQ